MAEEEQERVEAGEVVKERGEAEGEGGDGRGGGGEGGGGEGGKGKIQVQ